MSNRSPFRQVWLAVLLTLALGFETSLPAAPATAQDDPAPPADSGLAAEPYGWNSRLPAPADATVQQATTSCSLATLNPTLDYDGLYWDNYLVREVLLSNAPSAYYSYPTSFRLLENNDGFTSFDPDFDDAFGQFFFVPISTQRVVVDFNAALASPLGNTDDRLYFELYTYELSGDGDILGDLVDSYYVVPPSDLSPPNAWFPVGVEITDTNTIAQIQGRFAVLVVGTRVNGQNPAFDIYVDDVRARTCDSVDDSGGRIGGVITQGGTTPPGITSAQLLLVERDTDGNAATIATTTPDADGGYLFTGIGALPFGSSYQVWYQNEGFDTTRLASYASSLITEFNGSGQINRNIDIGGVTLGTPVDGAQVALPVTFSWSARALPSTITDSGYRLCLYDLSTYAQICTVDVLTTPSYTLSAADLIDNTDLGDFEFQYDRPYGWYVQVAGANYSAADFADIGFSFANEIIFVEQAPPPPPVENPSLVIPPDSSSTTPTWTVMVYIAGDNDLSSPVYSGNLREQFATLERIARNYKNTLNLIALVDFDENGDTRFCNLTALPDTPCETPSDPAEREKNTADPLVLTNFISSTVSTYQTDHYMLLISGHGHMVNGIALDETSVGAPSMTPAQLREAISDGTEPLRARGKKLDILYYYACLMGGLEAAFDAAPNADYLVASSDQAWVVDFYAPLLETIRANASDPAAIARQAVSDYRRQVEASAPGLFTSVAAYDLSRAASVRDALSDLGDALRTDTDAVDTTRAQVQVYDSSGDDRIDDPLKDAFVDLRDLAVRLRDSTTATTTVKTAATTLITALDATSQTGGKLVLASEQVSGLACTTPRDFSRATGLAVYFPSKDIYLPAEIDQYRRDFGPSFNTGSNWDEFIISYINKTPARAPGRSKRAGLPVGGGVPAACNYSWVPLVSK